MQDANFVLWGWEGFIPATYRHLSSDTLLIRLAVDPAVTPRCRNCEASCRRVHDTDIRRIRDMDLFEYRVWLEVPVRRVVCDMCGVGRERRA
jgi:transposase